MFNNQCSILNFQVPQYPPFSMVITLSIER